jgi:hypothetical protein
MGRLGLMASSAVLSDDGVSTKRATLQMEESLGEKCLLSVWVGAGCARASLPDQYSCLPAVATDTRVVQIQ